MTEITQPLLAYTYIKMTIACKLTGINIIINYEHFWRNWQMCSVTSKQNNRC